MQQEMQFIAQRQFVSFKILTLIAYGRLDLPTLCIKSEQRELQMDMVLMRMEELLEVKLPPHEVALFKKEFETFYLVPLRTLEIKIY
jgi:hypothetical protein